MPIPMVDDPWNDSRGNIFCRNNNETIDTLFGALSFTSPPVVNFKIGGL